jgi:branched-chain amino acid transport system substrate-binding protein
MKNQKGGAMRKEAKIFSLVLGLALVFSFSLGYAADAVKIGSLYPRTGNLARVGVECLRGVDLAAEVQNEKGGVLGKKI